MFQILSELLMKMQQVDPEIRLVKTFNSSILQAGLTSSVLPFSTYIPEEKLEPLRMEHFYLGKLKRVRRQNELSEFFFLQLLCSLVLEYCSSCIKVSGGIKALPQFSLRNKIKSSQTKLRWLIPNSISNEPKHPTFLDSLMSNAIKKTQ